MRIVINTLFLLCILLTSGCKEDEYVYPSVLTEFTDIRSDKSGKLSEIISDNGNKYIINERTGLEGFTPDSVYRTLSIFEPGESNKATLYSCQFVFSMKPQPADFFKNGIKTDPLDIQRIWQSGNYINMVLTIQGKDKPHGFHFVEEGISDNTLSITIYHDQNGDYKAFGKDVYISIPLWQYDGILNKGDKIKVNINTFKEGMTFREFEF